MNESSSETGIFNGLGPYMAQAYYKIINAEMYEGTSVEDLRSTQRLAISQCVTDYYRMERDKPSIYINLAANALETHIQHPARFLLEGTFPSLLPAVVFSSVGETYAQKYLYEVLSIRCSKTSSSPSSETVEREVERLLAEIEELGDKANLDFLLERFLSRG